MSVLDIPGGRDGLAQRVRTVDDRCDLSGLDELSHRCEVFGVLPGGQGVELLAHQLGSQMADLSDRMLDRRFGRKPYERGLTPASKIGRFAARTDFAA